MAKSIPAIVTPEVLVWARNLDSISIEEIASKLKVAPKKIEEWENGEAYPTLSQAKKLSNQYRVPFVYFYLPDTPQKKKRLDKTDYRTFGNGGSPISISRELRWFLRDIEDRRDAMFSLYEEEGKEPEVFPANAGKDACDENIADEIRTLLELTPSRQKTFRKAEAALTHCINALEKHDVLVFQAAKIAPKEMRGLSVAYDRMPIIAINRKDEPAARLFTLCHELVHILTKTSGICTDTSESSASKNAIEMRCNKIAGMILVPKGEISAHSAISKIKQYGFDDVYVNAIARDFAVSKEVVLHCLLEMEVIKKQFYFETLKRYSDEYLMHKAKAKKGFLPPVTDTATQVGRLYARTVLSAYYADKISARDTSNYLLNLKVKNFSKLERWCF